MPTLVSRTDALKHLRIILDTMNQLTATYGEAEPMEDDEAGNMEEEIVDRIIEEAAEAGMSEEGLEKIFRLILAYSRKSAE